MRSLALSLLFVVATTLATASAPTPQSARSLFLQLADQAQVDAQSAAKSGHAEDAKTWRAWERQYRELAISPAIVGKSALDITAMLAANNDKAAEKTSDPRAVALFRASARLWRDLHRQMDRGTELTIAFPHEMLTPIPGLDGTPWAKPVRATVSDCAAIAQRVRSCRLQVGRMEHDQMTGLYGDQSTPLLVRQAQCHRWEEAQLAYCSGH